MHRQHCWLRPCSRFVSFALFLNSSSISLFISHISTHESPAGFFQYQKTASAQAGQIAQNCTLEDIDQYIAAFKQPWQREEAVRQIVTSCNRIAIPTLIGVLKTEPDVGVRQVAAKALGYIGGVDASKALSDTLRNDSAAAVRQRAADGLGTIRDTTAIPLLIDTLEDSYEDKTVRQSAASSLADIGGPIAIDTLITMLQNTNESLKLRQSAVKALQTIKDPAIDSSVRALGSKDLQTQYWAVTVLSEISSERAIDTLETNKARVTEILEAAYKANIVEFDRAPAASTRKGTEQQLSRRPLLCKIPWIAEKWAKCQ
jgi:HEAT repeat protein